jgi:hypothetical protein
MRGDLWLSSDHQLSKVPHPPQKVYPPKCIRISKQVFFFRLQGWRRFRFYLSTDKYINSIPPEYENPKKCRLQSWKFFLKSIFIPMENIVCVKLSIRFFLCYRGEHERRCLYSSSFSALLCLFCCVCVCVSYNKASWASLGCATQQPRSILLYVKQKKAALITLSSSIHLRNVYRASMASSSQLLLLFIVPLSKPFFGSRYIVSSRIFLDQTASQKGEKYYLFLFQLLLCIWLQRHDM